MRTGSNSDWKGVFWYPNIWYTLHAANRWVEFEGLVLHDPNAALIALQTSQSFWGHIHMRQMPTVPVSDWPLMAILSKLPLCLFAFGEYKGSEDFIHHTKRVHVIEYLKINRKTGVYTHQYKNLWSNISKDFASSKYHSMWSSRWNNVEFWFQSYEHSKNLISLFHW